MNSQNNIPMKKKEYLRTSLTEAGKKNSKIAFIIFVISAVLLFISVPSFLNTPINEIPILEIVLEDDELDEFDDIFDMAEDEIEKAKDYIDDNEDDFTRKEIRAVNKFLDKMEKVTDKPSFSNLKSAYKAGVKIANLDNDDLDNVADFDDLEEEEEIISTLNIVTTVLYVFILIMILLVFLAAKNKSVGLAVLAMILSFPFEFCARGVVYALLIVVSLIVLSVFISKVNKEYKAYRVNVITKQ